MTRRDDIEKSRSSVRPMSSYGRTIANPGDQFAHSVWRDLAELMKSPHIKLVESIEAALVNNAPIMVNTSSNEFASTNSWLDGTGDDPQNPSIRHLQNHSNFFRIEAADHRADRRYRI